MCGNRASRFLRDDVCVAAASLGLQDWAPRRPHVDFKIFRCCAWKPHFLLLATLMDGTCKVGTKRGAKAWYSLIHIHAQLANPNLRMSCTVVGSLNRFRGNFCIISG